MIGLVLKVLLRLRAVRRSKEVYSQEKRYDITSLEKDAVKIGNTIRSHWSIENNLH